MLKWGMKGAVCKALADGKYKYDKKEKEAESNNWILNAFPCFIYYLIQGIDAH